MRIKALKLTPESRAVMTCGIFWRLARLSQRYRSALFGAAERPAVRSYVSAGDSGKRAAAVSLLRGNHTTKESNDDSNDPQL